MLKHMNSNPYKNLTESDAYKKNATRIKSTYKFDTTSDPTF